MSRRLLSGSRDAVGQLPAIWALRSAGRPAIRPRARSAVRPRARSAVRPRARSAVRPRARSAVCPRARSAIRRHKRCGWQVGLLAACGLLGITPTAAVARAASRGHAARVLAAQAAGSPLTYLLGAQNEDGGFGMAAGQQSSPMYSDWAALALVADGRNPAAVARGASSLLAYIEANLESDPGSLERTILVARAAGVSAASFGGHNLLAALRRDIRRDGSVSDQVNLTTFAVLALRAARVTPPARMLSWLVRQQNADGGFSYATAGDLADVDDTGATLEAISATAPSARRRAVAFVRAAQNRDGGFPAEPGESSNAQSTAWAVQGLIAAGIDPARVRVHGSPSPLRYLRALITASGAIDYSRGLPLTPVWVTAQAIPALDGKPFPLRPPASQ